MVTGGAGIQIHVNQMCDGPRGQVDWGLSDCFLRKRAHHHIAAIQIYVAKHMYMNVVIVIILLADLLTNVLRLGNRLWILGQAAAVHRLVHSIR